MASKNLPLLSEGGNGVTRIKKPNNESGKTY